jgi:hypothetical protein
MDSRKGSNINCGLRFEGRPRGRKKRWGRSVLPYQEPEESR